MKIASGPLDGAWQFLSVGQYDQASRLASKVLSTDPDNASALACRGMADWSFGRSIKRAIADLQRAAEIAPQAASIHHNLATLLASDGQIAAAEQGFRRALSLKPDDSRAFYGLTQNFRFTEREPLIDDMLALYGSGTLNRQGREFLCFGLAKVFDDLGDSTQAIHFCLEANWLAERPFDMAVARRRFASLTSLAESGALAEPARGHISDAPVFIVGAPRSGTTLMETVLSRHPAVWPTGESDRVMAAEARLTGGFYRKLPEATGSALKSEGEGLLREMRRDGGQSASIVTDKTPANVFTLGTISRLFPNARVIHMRRHPVDCGISNLFVRFAEGQGFSFHQGLLGEMLRQNADLMETWKRTLPIRILDVSYEALVGEPEAQTRRVVDFLGLPWDPACLTPDQAKRQIQTASQWQVRQPIHSRSVGRWKSYEAWLQPMIEAMGGKAWIDAEMADQRRAGSLVSDL